MLVCLLLIYILATSKAIAGRVPTCDSAYSRWLYSAAPLKNQSISIHDLISHSVTLFSHWANQSLPFPDNYGCLARKWQVSILKSLLWLDKVSKAQAPDLNPWSSYSPMPQKGSRALYSFSHPDWLSFGECVAHLVRTWLVVMLPAKCVKSRRQSIE